MNKIMTVQNPNTRETSCILVGETLETRIVEFDDNTTSDSHIKEPRKL